LHGDPEICSITLSGDFEARNRLQVTRYDGERDLGPLSFNWCEKLVCEHALRFNTGESWLGNVDPWIKSAHGHLTRTAARTAWYAPLGLATPDNNVRARS